MTSPEAVVIEPYLNPNYWDGHTLGIGELTGHGPVRVSYRDDKFAKHIIETRVRGGTPMPLHTFRAGDTFNPEDHEPGTVTLLRQEMIYGAPVTSDYDIAKIAQQEIPDFQTATSPAFGNLSPLTAIFEHKRLYLDHVRWGVVPRDADPNRLSTTPASRLMQVETGVRAKGSFVNTLDPIHVGEVRHIPQTKGVPEQVQRVNILHIVAYGATEREKKKFFAFFGRTAFGNV